MKNKEHLLFVCTANLNRSPTAKSLFKNNKKYEAKSAGIHPLSENPITKQAIKWADIIFVMDEKNDKHKTFLLREFPEAAEKKIIILGVPDIYTKNNPQLIKILKKKLRKLLSGKWTKLEN